jgi:hypothetical protein
VQVAMIGELCDWCLINDALVTVLAGLVLLRAVAAPAATTASRGTSRSRASTGSSRSRRHARA